MLKFTERQMFGIAMAERRRLRPSLLQHWSASLRASFDAVGPEHGEQVILEVEQLAADNASLDLADLMMIADLRLMALASESRKSRLASAH